MIILETVESTSDQGEFQKAMKWQRIEIPLALRGEVRRPRSRRFVQRDFRAMPAHPRHSEPDLLGRGRELVGPMMRFTVDFGLRNMGSRDDRFGDR